MTGFTNTFFYELTTLFVVLNPFVAIPLYLALTHGLERKRQLAVAAYAVGIAFLVLLVFIALGQHLLEALRIPMPAFQLGGALVLLLFAFRMVTGQVAAAAATLPPETTSFERSVSLAVPQIAGAGSMLTVVLLTDNHTRSLAEQVTTTGTLAVCLAVYFVVLALASFILKVIGRAGVEVITRVFGLILASVAVNSLIVAIKLSFGLA
ncbi:MAG TPA: MarC family protein [Reyranellaceae bacterium]|nr:MarC family protein [Reyranellaceae bacterium]